MHLASSCFSLNPNKQVGAVHSTSRAQAVYGKYDLLQNKSRTWLMAASKITTFSQSTVYMYCNNPPNVEYYFIQRVDAHVVLSAFSHTARRWNKPHVDFWLGWKTREKLLLKHITLASFNFQHFNKAKEIENMPTFFVNIFSVKPLHRCCKHSETKSTVMRPCDSVLGNARLIVDFL